MICEATKVAAQPIEASRSESGENIAVSVRVSFEQISSVADLNTPLRRPARRCPSREFEQDYADLIAARVALAADEEVCDYQDFRKEAGLGN